MLRASRKFREQRGAEHYRINRYGKIQGRVGTLPRDGLIVDISDTGIRLHTQTFEVPDEFIVLISGAERGRSECRVVWRFGFEIGAAFTDLRSGFAARVLAAPNL